MPLTTSPRGHAGPTPIPTARHVAAPDRKRRVRLARTVGVLLLLAGLVTAGSPGWFTYTIRSGDTLSEIAARYHTTVAKLVQANRLPGNGNLIYAGGTLRIPGGSSHGGGGSAGGGTRHHVVVRGDTLSEIALHYGVSASVIARANHLPSSLMVRIGQTLTIPGGRSRGHTAHHSHSSANSFAGRTYPSSTVAAAAHNRAVLARRHLPSRDQMRDLIVSISRANGVDSALALAVSWQEAGWEMHHVSVANAIGAMQVVPSTGDWISQVIGRRLDLLKPRDNVTAGVVLLKVLTEQASERQAVAGYYQGLQSVRDHGMYPDTRRYVANVMAIKRWYD